MLTLDTFRKQVHAQKSQIEKHREEVKSWVLHESRHACYVRDWDSSVANLTRQLGKPLQSFELKGFIERTNPKLKVEKHPFKDKQCIYWVNNGVKTFVAACENSLIPEWSVMGVEKKERPASFSGKFEGISEESIPWREEKRGWRTTLAMLVTAGLLPWDKVERFVAKHGTQDRQAWQTIMGKNSEEAVF